MAQIRLKNLKKSYGATKVIHGIDMDIPTGEFCVFVGPSGCGKSTLLRMIAGLEDITSGEIEIDGEVVNNITAAQRGLAMVFQSYALYPHMSVRKNLSFGLENINMPKAEIDTRVTNAARMLQIDEYLERKPGQLSGGQRQRVAIGRAVVREPRAFLFDEPLSNLDAELRVATRGEISTLHSDLGNTMIYVTHDQVEAMTMADKIAVLRAGKLEQFGPPLELFNRPANLFVAGFIGSPSMNFLNGTACNGGVDVPGLGAVVDAPVALKEGQNVVLGIRPEHLSIAAGDTHLVELTEALGGVSYAYLKAPSGEKIVVEERGDDRSHSGARVGLTFELSRTYVFDATSEKRIR